MIVKIKYIAIKMDNYQGGSGKPYTGEYLFSIENLTTIGELYKMSTKFVEKMNYDRSDFSDGRNITAIEIIEETIINKE